MKNCEVDDKQVKYSLNQIVVFGTNILPAKIFLIANFLASNIKIRVQDRGQGIKGALKKYTKQYEAYRKQNGRQVGHKDLTFSGEMFNSMTVTDAKGLLGSPGARISFGSSDGMLKAIGNNARSEFFGIGKEEEAIVNGELAKVMGDLKL